MPRPCSHSRSAPVTTARTTSLTVPPSASLIRLKVASSERAQTKRRCGPISWLSGTSGAGSAKAPTTSPTPSSALGDPARRRLRVAHRLDRALGELQRRRGERRSRPRVDQRRGARLRPRLPVVDALGAASAPARGRRGRCRCRRRRSRRPSRGGSWSGSRSGRARGPAPATAPRAAWSGRAAARRRGPASRFSSSSPPGSGSAGVADVVGEVEVDVVRPERPARLQRRHDEALAEARHLVEAAADVLDQVDVERRRPLEDQDRADVHVARRASRWSGTRRRRRSADRDGLRWCSWLQG